MFGLDPYQLLLLALLIVLPVLPNLWSIRHIFHRDFNTAQEKMAWLALTIFIPVLGGLIYILAGRQRAINNN